MRDEDNAHYLMSCGPYIQAYRLEKFCEHLDLKGYGVSDLGEVDLIGVVVAGVKYSYGDVDKIPVKENELEKEVIKNE